MSAVPVRRRLTALGCLLVLAAGSVSAGHPSETATGEARTAVIIASLGIDNLVGVGDLDAVVGGLEVYASNIDEPLARLGLEGVDAGGQTAAWEAESTDGRRDGSVTVPVEHGPARVHASLLNYLAEVGGRDARAAIGLLTAEADVSPLSVAVGLAEEATIAEVTPEGSRTGTSLSIDSVSIDLVDLLPADLLDALPLSVLVEIASLLDLPLPGDVTEAVETVHELLETLRQAVAVSDRLAEVRAALPGDVGESVDLGAAEDAVDDAEAALDAAEADLDAARADLSAAQADLDAAQPALDSARGALATAQADLDAATADLTAAQADLDAAIADVTATQTSLDDANATVADLNAQIAALDPVLDAVQIANLTAQLLTAESTRDSLQSDLADAQAVQADAQAAVDTAQGVVDSAQAAVDAAQADVDAAQATVDAAQGVVDTAQAAVDAAQAAVDAAQAALDDAVAALDDVLDGADLTDEVRDLLREVRELERRLRRLLDDVGDLLDGLPDLRELRLDLLDGLSDAPLLRISGLGIGVEVAADADGGRTSAICSGGVVEILGSAVAVPDCAALAGALGGLEDKVAGAVAALPVTAVPDVRLAGFATQTSASDGPDDEGTSRASATVSGLRIQVPSVGLVDVVDELRGLLETALTDVGPVLGAAGGLHALALPGGLDDVIADALTQFDALPTGEVLSGLRTVGLDIHLAEIVADVAYSATGQLDQTLLALPVLPVPSGETGDPTAAPEVPAPEVPEGSVPELPVTGATTPLVGIAAMLLALGLGLGARFGGATRRDP